MLHWNLSINISRYVKKLRLNFSLKIKNRIYVFVSSTTRFDCFVKEKEKNCRVACHKSSLYISLIASMANSFVSWNRNYRLFASLFPLAIFQTRARVITKYYVAGDTCLVNSITSENSPHYLNIRNQFWPTYTEVETYSDLIHLSHGYGWYILRMVQQNRRTIGRRKCIIPPVRSPAPWRKIRYVSHNSPH